MLEQTFNNDVTLTGGENPLLARRYQVVRQLGAGGMGSVWLAEDTQLDNKLFAIKMLPSILVANKRAYRQLKDEALVAMRLVHPNIMQIRAFEENDGNPFLVMDYIEGQTLEDYIADKGTLSEDETVRLLQPVAAALDYAHGEGVVHRDVKPANVMIRKDGRPFVLDFGIAREIQETMTRVTGKLSSGTLLYMSPEQLNGEPPRKEQDVYSFAAMVYECLKGEPPFVRGQIEYQIVNNPPPPLPQGVASWLSSATMRGLAKKANERPATCCELLSGSSLGGNDAASLIQQATKAFRDKEYEKAFSIAQKADESSPDIQYILGWCYALGDGVEEDYDKAMLWLHKAASQGSVKSLQIMGKLYLEIFDCDLHLNWEDKDFKCFREWFDMASENNQVYERAAYFYVRSRYNDNMDIWGDVDEKKDVKLIRDAAINGYHRAQYQLARRYETGDGVPQDYAEAVEWYRKAAEQGTQAQYAGAQEKLGEMYKKGFGVAKNYDEAIKWYRKAVESINNTRNVYNLAQMYETAKKYSDAVEWYRKAAERGFSDAQCKLGDLYRSGRAWRGKSAMERVKEAIKWYRMSAEQDNAKAQYELAHCLIFLDDDCNVSKEALTWLRKSGEQGYGDAQHELGAGYANPREGDCITKDIAESTRWYKLAEQSYRKAAEGGDVSAQCNLGLMFYNGEGVIQDFKEAFRWLNKAAMRGNRSSQYYLGNCFSRAQGVSQDYMEAANWYRKAAERGEAKAQYELGYMYKKGIGVAQDYKVAMAWFLKAAEQHNQDACYELGCMYKTGLGVEQDYVKAMGWYQKASSHNGAEYNLGLMYENGYGVKVDYNEARKHYTFAAVCENADAAFCCGRLYYHGLGVGKNYAKAIEWFQEAATKEHVGAQYYLGLMHYNGEGFDQNDSEAAIWFRKAAERGDADAQYALGVLYQSGQGVTKDDIEAMKWYRKAAEQGHSDAVVSLKELTGEVLLGNVSKTEHSNYKSGHTSTLVWANKFCDEVAREGE